MYGTHMQGNTGVVLLPAQIAKAVAESANLAEVTALRTAEDNTAITSDTAISAGMRSLREKINGMIPAAVVAAAAADTEI